MATSRNRRGARGLIVVGATSILLVAAITAVWFWALTYSSAAPPPIEPAMAAMPEANLVYPNAMNVHRSGAGTECRDGQWQPALVEYTFSTSDSVHDVFVWYSQRLTPLGWNGAIPDTIAGYSLTRDTDDLFSIEVKLGAETSSSQSPARSFQFTTGFQHVFKSGSC